MTNKKKSETHAPVAEFTYSDGKVRRLEYPDPPTGLVRFVNKTHIRPNQLTFHPPGEDWEASRIKEDRPVNQSYLAQWKDRCHNALSRSNS